MRGVSYFTSTFVGSGGATERKCWRSEIIAFGGKWTIAHAYSDTMYQVYMATFDPRKPIGKIYIDLFHRFPTISIRGHNCIMFIYDYENNSILSNQIKSY